MNDGHVLVLVAVPVHLGIHAKNQKSLRITILIGLLIIDTIILLLEHITHHALHITDLMQIAPIGTGDILNILINHLAIFQIINPVNPMYVHQNNSVCFSFYCNVYFFFS